MQRECRGGGCGAAVQGRGWGADVQSFRGADMEVLSRCRAGTEQVLRFSRGDCEGAPEQLQRCSCSCRKEVKKRCRGADVQEAEVQRRCRGVIMIVQVIVQQ